jgi:hypothetical protein
MQEILRACPELRIRLVGSRYRGGRRVGYLRDAGDGNRENDQRVGGDGFVALEVPTDNADTVLTFGERYGLRRLVLDITLLVHHPGASGDGNGAARSGRARELDLARCATRRDPLRPEQRDDLIERGPGSRIDKAGSVDDFQLCVQPGDLQRDRLGECSHHASGLQVREDRERCRGNVVDVDERTRVGKLSPG